MQRPATPVHSSHSAPEVEHGRLLHRSFEEEYLEQVRTYHTTEPYQKAMRKRSVWVEPLFAEGKDWHGMRRFRLRRLWRVNCEALMRAADAASSLLFGFPLLFPWPLKTFFELI